MDTLVYRIDILKKAKEYLKTGKYKGICSAILDAFAFYGIPINNNISYYIPQHNLTNAKKFWGKEIYCFSYWWKPYRFNILSGRRRYLNWLIRQYKNDKTNLREL